MADDDRIQELLSEYGDRLTPWEQEFLDSLDEWNGDLTPAQDETLGTIHERITRSRRGR